MECQLYCVCAVDEQFAEVVEQVVDDESSFKQNGLVKCVASAVVDHSDRLLVGTPTHVCQVTAGDGAMQLAIFLLNSHSS